jgi:hypothetical protein
MNSNGNRLARSNVKLEVETETHKYLPITKDEAKKLVIEVEKRI